MAGIELKDRNDNETAYTGISKLKIPAADGGDDVVFQLPPIMQEKAVTITENGTTSIVPDEGKDGLSKVDVTVDVAGGGGTSVQSDWTQNDATAADHVKNRPGGYDVYSSELAATGSFPIEGEISSNVDFPVKFIVDGQKVTVKIDNETFERTVHKVPDDKKINSANLAEYGIFSNENSSDLSGFDNGWALYFQLESAGTWEKFALSNAAYNGKAFEVYAEVATPMQFPAKYVNTKFIVTCTIAQDSNSDWVVSNPSHTLDEILSAYRSGMDVVLQAHIDEAADFILPLQAVDSDVFLWGFMNIELGILSIMVQKEGDTDSWSAYVVDPVTQDQLSEIRQLPESSGADDGKFLRVVNGAPTWEAVSDTTIKLKSSTAGSTKYFNITVNDDGQITATEAT